LLISNARLALRQWSAKRVSNSLRCGTLEGAAMIRPDRIGHIVLKVKSLERSRPLNLRELFGPTMVCAARDQ